jgi:hypothetical protein
MKKKEYMHLIDIGYRFMGKPIFIQTNSFVDVERFRAFIYRHHIQPKNLVLYPDITTEEEWVNLLKA